MYMILINESHVFELRNFETKFEVCDPRILCVCVCASVCAFLPVTLPDKLFRDKHVESALFSWEVAKRLSKFLLAERAKPFFKVIVIL